MDVFIQQQKSDSDLVVSWCLVFFLLSLFLSATIIFNSAFVACAGVDEFVCAPRNAGWGVKGVCAGKRDEEPVT